MFSFSSIPSKEIAGLISFRMDWLDLLAVQGTLKSLLQHHRLKASILRCSAFFTVHSLSPCQYNFLVFVYACMCSVAQLWPTLCDPMDCSLSGSSVHGISQARTLQWVATSSSRGSSPSRIDLSLLHWQVGLYH